MGIRAGGSVMATLTEKGQRFLDIEFYDSYNEFGAEDNYCKLSIDLYSLDVEYLGALKEVLTPTCSLYYKVVDTGVYTLRGDSIGTWEISDDYVPDCIPNDWGDYIDLEFYGKHLMKFRSTIEDIEIEFLEKGTQIESVKNDN